MRAGPGAFFLLVISFLGVSGVPSRAEDSRVAHGEFGRLEYACDTGCAPGGMDVEIEHVEALQRGIEAMRQRDLAAASKAFEQAYQLKPHDPEVLSWLALVRDERDRRVRMTRAVKRVEEQQQAAAETGLAADQAAPEGSSPSGGLPGAFANLITPVGQTRPEIQDITKRAGFQRLYKEGIGLQPIRGLGFSSRVEIFEEPNPVDDFVLEAKIMNLDEISEFRRSIMPLFTRSWAGRTVLDVEPWPRLTYEYDEREILHELENRFAVKDRHLRTHAFNALYTFQHVPLFGNITLNPWYKRILQDAESDIGSQQHKDEGVFNFSVQPHENIEYFFQYDTQEARKTQVVGGSKLQLFKGQLRVRFPSLRLFAIPSYEYSRTTYDPGDDEFTKQDIFLDWGFDVTKRIRASSKEQMVLTELTQAGNSPSNPTAQTYATQNTLSYELLKDFDVSLGLDYARAAGMNSYNNVGLRVEAELFKPGILRSKIGYEWVSYYNIDDSLSLLYWRLFLFQ